jgi:hypothetical protein
LVANSFLNISYYYYLRNNRLGDAEVDVAKGGEERRSTASSSLTSLNLHGEEEQKSILLLNNSRINLKISMTEMSSIQTSIQSANLNFDMDPKVTKKSKNK